MEALQFPWFKEDISPVRASLQLNKLLANNLTATVTGHNI